MSINYSYVDWPAIPEDLATKCIDSVNCAEDIWGKGQGRPNSSLYQIYDAPEEFKKWAYSHLPIDESYYIRVQRLTPTKIFNIHTDHGRSITYNYLLQGEGAYTAWYDSELKPIEHVKFKNHQWARLDVSVPHNVLNITVDRIAVTINQADLTVKYQTFGTALK